MNPISPENPKPARLPGLDAPAASLADTLANKRKNQARVNRRASTSPTNRAYTMLLLASTLVAAAFCLLYITKPVIVTMPEADLQFPNAALARTPDPRAQTPADGSTQQPAVIRALHGNHEETNLRVQHVLNATTADGDLSRVVLDVPVIYASRHLRWTEAEVARARAIHARLGDFHEQSRQLRELGAGILADWNELIEQSIPIADLRADSPSLPANQEDAAHLPRPAILDSTDAIEIQPSGP
jgi:hypothetical protein